MSATCGKISEEELVTYWAGELDQADVDRIDEHVMGCAPCTEASERVSAVIEALRGLIPEFLDHARLESLRSRGYRIRENPVQPDERRTVVFDAATDLLIHQLKGLDLTSASSVGITVTVEETGVVLLAAPTVPFDRDSGEVLIACQAHFAELPPNIVAEVRTRDASGAERVARYPIPHVFEARGV